MADSLFETNNTGRMLCALFGIQPKATWLLHNVLYNVRKVRFEEGRRKTIKPRALVRACKHTHISVTKNEWEKLKWNPEERNCTSSGEFTYQIHTRAAHNNLSVFEDENIIISVFLTYSFSDEDDAVWHYANAAVQACG